MLSQSSLIVFYSVCGLIVTWMLFRVWRKNRKTNPVVPPRAPRPVPVPAAERREVVQQPVEKPAAPQPIMAPAVEAAVIAPVVMRSAAAITTDSAATGASSSWDQRRLLEPTGLFPRNTEPMPRVLPEEVPGVDDSDRIFGNLLNPLFAALLPESEIRREANRKDLMTAGYYNPHAVENLAAIRYALMMLGLVLFGALLLIVPPRLEPWMMAGCILVPILGWAFPALYIRGKARERRQEIERAMPDLLDMLNMCVGQGLTVPDSLQRIGRDFRPVYPALSEELTIVNEQSKISSMPVALENFSRRIELPEINSLTSLLIQTERMGTSISQALVTYSDTMRESQRQQADEKGNRATFNLLFPTVLCLMPAVYLFLLGPAVVELQKFFNGGGLDAVTSNAQAVEQVNSNRRAPQNPGTLTPRRRAAAANQ